MPERRKYVERPPKHSVRMVVLLVVAAIAIALVLTLLFTLTRAPGRRRSSTRREADLVRRAPLGNEVGTERLFRARFAKLHAQVVEYACGTRACRQPKRFEEQ